jgi:hypothetical protein
MPPGVDGNLTYFYQRPSYSFTNNFYYADLKNLDTTTRWTPSIVFLLLVGIVWLGVGLFVLFKQGGNSPFVLHFAIVSLAAFVFHAYKPIGLGADFDLAVSLLDNIAFAFFVPLFLHFCLRYPVRSEVFDRSRWKTYALYVPAAIISLANVFFSIILILPIGEGNLTALAEFVDRIDLFVNLDLGKFDSVYCRNFIWRGYFIMAVQQKSPADGSAALEMDDVGNDCRRRADCSFSDCRAFHLSAGRYDFRRHYDFAARFDSAQLRSFGRALSLDGRGCGRPRALVYAMTTVAIAMMIGAVALLLVYLVTGKNLSNTEITCARLSP